MKKQDADEERNGVANDALRLALTLQAALDMSFPVCPVCNFRRPLSDMLKATHSSGRVLRICRFCKAEIVAGGKR